MVLKWQKVNKILKFLYVSGNFSTYPGISQLIADFLNLSPNFSTIAEFLNLLHNFSTYLAISQLIPEILNLSLNFSTFRWTSQLVADFLNLLQIFSTYCGFSQLIAEWYLTTRKSVLHKILIEFSCVLLYSMRFLASKK